MKTVFASLASVIILSACSGISTSVDWDESFDFGSLSSYAWMDQAPEGGVSEIMLRRMYVAVDGELAAKGFTRTDADGADFLMAYHTGTQDRQQYDTYGYGAGSWWGGYWGGGIPRRSTRWIRPSSGRRPSRRPSGSCSRTSRRASGRVRRR
jgi:hypothetical protein